VLSDPPGRHALPARGDDRNRTGVNGFAGRCVATPPRRQVEDQRIGPPAWPGPMPSRVQALGGAGSFARVSFVARKLLTRVGKGIPVARLLLAADVAVMAGRHVSHLDSDERRRLLALLALGARHPRSLDAAQRDELAALVAKLEPRLFLGRAVRRVSPVPLPARLLYGKRSSPARAAARRKA
jgi:hypothetical protein